MFEEIEIGGKVYRLKLTTRTSIGLEKALGYNPITMLMKIDDGEMPTLQQIIIILHAMLQADNHGITIDRVYDLFDSYAEDGHNMFDLIPVFINVFQNCGYISTTGEAEKN